MTETMAGAGQAEQVAAIQRAIDNHREQAGNLLPILHAIQDELGYIPPEAFAPLAAALHQTRAEISGVVSFYHHFRSTPPGDHVVQICRAEACQALGARQLEGYIKDRLAIDFHQTTADGRVTLEPVYCLGNCSCGPSLRVDDDVLGRVSKARFDALLDDMATEKLELR